ncbi:MAG: DUF6502 family protein [Sterolibacterium sp.]|jgi:hypothetical protein
MSESRSDLALAAALRLAEPLVALLLQEGVNYSRFAGALKATFVEAAEKVLEADQARVTDSSVSTLSGVHRKDVRAWRLAGKALPRSPNLNAVMVLYTRWANDPAYCDARGKPRVLDRVGETGSFDALALSVSNDVHPRTLLQELVRLGVVRQLDSEDGSEKLMLCADAFVPKAGFEEMLRLFAANVGDHIATAVHNIESGAEPLLEQSVYANKLSRQSAEALGALSRQIWADAFRRVAAEATKLCRRDEGRPEANQRVRFGMYYYQGPVS